MPCYHPVAAYRIGDKQGRNFGVVFAVTKGMNVLQEMRVPCGQCIGCRLERARQWAVRCMHEASMHERNCFITLTYNEDHIPDGRSLEYSDFQKFMKRLRKEFCYYLPTSKHHGPFRRVRFFMCGEYGETFGRPHFHACLFGIDFDDRVYFKTTSSGSKLYTSKTLDALWTDKDGDSIGYATLGVVNFDSAGYVARYVMEKGYGQSAAQDLEYIDLETGEVIKRTPEFNRMSLRPGIGHGFYEKYFTDIFPHDYVVINGKKMKPPRYYVKKLSQDDGFAYDELLYQRGKDGLSRSFDNTPDRLEVKEKVTRARINFLKREKN